MAEWLTTPNEQARMTPIEGLRFYADALRGDWGSIDGRGEKAALNEYIDWAATVEGQPTTEAEVFEKLRSCLGVYVVEEAYPPDFHDRRGKWAQHVEDLIEAEYEAANAAKQASV